MKKVLRLIVVLALSVMCAFGTVACGDGNKTPNGGNGGEGGNTTNTGLTGPVDIDFYTTVNIIEQNALNVVVSAYNAMQEDNGTGITVYINNSTDPTSYSQNVKNMLGNGVKNPTIVQTSVAPEYYGTSKIVDLTEVLEQPNPYIAGNTAWMDAMEPDAYRTQISGSTATIPGISYSCDYLTVFYNKKAMLDVMGDDPAVGEDGTVDQSRITWEWMLNALETARNSGKHFDNPLGLSVNEASCGEDGFNKMGLIMKMYLDQYFRDFTEEVHSRDGDFSYIASIDADWTYDANNPILDLSSNYTYNINRVVDTYFNNPEYAPTSERYTELMKNLYDFAQYADKEASYLDIFSRFNETTIVYENNYNKYEDRKLFYVEDLAYIRTYRDAFKSTVNGKTVYPSAEKIFSQLGCFSLPAMNSNLDGVADNVRPFGGPVGSYGVINTGDQAKNNAAIDFLRYLYSPTGQAAIYARYKSENNAPVVMRQLIKNVNIPADVDYTGLITVEGGCETSPYLMFGRGSDMYTTKIGNTNDNVIDKVSSSISQYFRGDVTWTVAGQDVFNAIKSGFSNYAAEHNFVYTDPANVKSATNNLVNSPYNTSI